MSDRRSPRLRLGVLDWLGVRYSLLDDAGTQHRVDTSAIWSGRVRRSTKLREALRRPRQAFLPKPGVGIVVIVAMALLMAPVQAAINSTTWPLSVKMVALAPVFMAPPTALTMSISSQFRRRPGEYIRLMKARALCPACIYSLEGVEVPAEGLVTCPECGARWRFEVDAKSAPGGVV